MKLASSWEDCEVTKETTKSKLRLNFKTSATCHGSRSKPATVPRTGQCLQARDLEICTQVEEYSSSSGCRSCRNGLELLVLLFVSIPREKAFWIVLTQIDAPTIFRMAGFDTEKSQWISGLNNIFYMVSLLPFP